jgi:hypothetical protein
MIHQHHRIATAAALALALAASIAPAASADPHPLTRAETAIANTPDRPPATPATCGDVCSGHGYGNVDVVALSPRVRPTPTAAPNAGLDWGDAGVGAGGMLALILIGTGGALTVARRRSHTVTPTPRPNPQAQG